MKEYLPHQQRVIEEQYELMMKSISLHAFLKTQQFKTLPLDEMSRLIRQAKVMDQYSDILAERIAAFL